MSGTPRPTLIISRSHRGAVCKTAQNDTFNDLTFNDLEALPAAKLGEGFVVPPASHIRTTPLPFDAFARSSRNSVFSSTGLQGLGADLRIDRSLCNESNLHSGSQSWLKAIQQTVLLDPVCHKGDSSQVFFEVWLRPLDRLE